LRGRLDRGREVLRGDGWEAESWYVEAFGV
jgi:hypothetical protein